MYTNTYRYGSPGSTLGDGRPLPVLMVDPTTPHPALSLSPEEPSSTHTHACTNASTSAPRRLRADRPSRTDTSTSSRSMTRESDTHSGTPPFHPISVMWTDPCPTRVSPSAHGQDRLKTSPLPHGSRSHRNKGPRADCYPNPPQPLGSLVVLSSHQPVPPPLPTHPRDPQSPHTLTHTCVCTHTVHTGTDTDPTLTPLWRSDTSGHPSHPVPLPHPHPRGTKGLSSE